jgi:pimeloyl-CoA dehydrogenase large subunit
MDLAFSKEEMAFREEVRAFFRDNVPPATRQKLVEGRHLSKDEMIAWWRILNKKGWGCSHWPKEYGGTGWSSVQHYIFNEELQMHPAPAPLAFGVSMVGPVIYTFGNETQKKQYLPRIANVDDWWCQGFSEPGSGSDLASLKTKAERKGDKYIINGQKTWTTLAQHADMIFCLCRTDNNAKKQMGISFIVFSMKSKGVTVRPIQTIDGGHEVNEVFFDDVEAPVENLIGEENKGWDYAKFLLGNERTGIARVGVSKERLRRIKELASKVESNGKPVIEDQGRIRMYVGHDGVAIFESDDGLHFQATGKSIGGGSFSEMVKRFRGMRLLPRSRTQLVGPGRQRGKQETTQLAATSIP